MNIEARRPPLFSIFLILGLSLGVVSAYLAFQAWRRSLPPMQQVYLGTYCKLSYVPKLTLRRGATDPYLVYVYKDQGEVLAVTDVNLSALKTTPYWTTHYWTKPEAIDWFQTQIYSQREVTTFLTTPFGICIALFMLFACAGAYIDHRRRVALRSGTVLRGPLLSTRWQFNRRIKGDGIGFILDNWRNPIELLKGKEGKIIRINRDYESQHIEVIGDTGAGKTVGISQILDQIEARGEIAIIFDPEREFIQRYLNAARGDLVANPLDARGFSWGPSDEIDFSSQSRAEAMALAQAESLYPGSPRDRDWFFVNSARLIWLHSVVTYKPTAAELAELMTHANPLIDAVVKGTGLEEMFSKAQSAQGLRSSVISTLTAPAFALRQIPPHDGRRPHLCIRDFCEKREGGWVFLTSDEESITALKPLQSLWLDSFIRNLLSMPVRPGQKKVWIVIDELASLQYLPQLTNAMNKARKRDVSVVLGFQGRSQPKKIYGEDAETILSAPYTKLIMRTGEPEAQEWMSKWIGEQEVERFRETRGNGRGARHSYTPDIVNRRIVMPSQFTGLENRVGYLRYGDEVVKIKLAKTWDRPLQAIPYIPRVDNAVVPKPMPNLAGILAKEEAERQAAAEKMADQVFPPASMPKGTLVPKGAA